MAGYHGYSMSNNAVQAYGAGERPRSRWNRADMLAEIADQMTGKEDYTMQDVERLRASEIRGLFLVWSSWHHTSSMYNRTEFYRVDSTPVTLELINETISNRTAPEPKRTAHDQKCRVRFGQWEGTRRHPRLKWYEAYAIIREKWVYLEGGSRIRTDRSHLEIIATFGRAPRGTADTFGQIAKQMQKGTK